MTMLLPRGGLQEWVFLRLYDLTGGRPEAMTFAGCLMAAMLVVGCVIALRCMPDAPGDAHGDDDERY